MIYIIILLAVALIIAALLSKNEDASDKDAWEKYMSSETSQAQRILSRAARPIASMPALQKQVRTTKTYRHFETKLRAGGAYAGSLEIYLSMQILTIMIGIAIFGAVLFFNVTGFWLFMGVAFGALLMGLPYNKVYMAAKNRTDAVIDSLPDFAELLSMVLPNSSILTAMAFTAERTTGPVAEEITAMVSSITTRTLSEAEAFQLAAERLGTPEARSFITTLMNAYLEGTKALDAIKAQAESMRKVSYQKQRERAKKLPNRLIVVFGLHFMPALFIVALMPLALGIGRTLG